MNSTTARATEREKMERYEIGDSVSWGAGTDTNCGTVVGSTGNTVQVVKDNAKLMNGPQSGAVDAMRFESGGYVGHTSGAQRYELTPGDGPVLRFSYRKKLDSYKLAGTSVNGSMRGWGVLFKGSVKHYDFNF